jgi:hypothetical protein
MQTISAVASPGWSICRDSCGVQSGTSSQISSSTLCSAARVGGMPEAAFSISLTVAGSRFEGGMSALPIQSIACRYWSHLRNAMARTVCSSQRSGLRPFLRRRRRNAPIAVAATALFSVRSISSPLPDKSFPLCVVRTEAMALAVGQSPCTRRTCHLGGLIFVSKHLAFNMQNRMSPTLSGVQPVSRSMMKRSWAATWRRRVHCRGRDTKVS